MVSNSLKFEFDKRKVQDAEEEYKTLKLDPAQRGMVEAMSKFMTGFIPISEMAIKGFTWKVMQK